MNNYKRREFIAKMNCITTCCVIDNLIDEIFERGSIEYDELDSVKKFALRKLVIKKSDYQYSTRA